MSSRLVYVIYHVIVLGDVPLHIKIRETSDQGVPIVLSDSSSDQVGFKNLFMLLFFSIYLFIYLF